MKAFEKGDQFTLNSSWEFNDGTWISSGCVFALKDRLPDKYGRPVQIATLDVGGYNNPAKEFNITLREINNLLKNNVITIITERAKQKKNYDIMEFGY